MKHTRKLLGESAVYLRGNEILLKSCKSIYALVLRPQSVLCRFFFKSSFKSRTKVGIFRINKKGLPSL